MFLDLYNNIQINYLACLVDNLIKIKKFDSYNISTQNSAGTFRITDATLILYKISNIVLGEFRGNCFKDTTVNSQSTCDISTVLPDEFFPFDDRGTCVIVNAIYNAYHFEFTISNKGILKIGYSSSLETGHTWFRETFSYLSR